MTAKQYDFRQQFIIGAQGEKTLDDYFDALFIITPASDAEQRRGIDRHFEHRQTGEKHTVEYKTDVIAYKTHNAFIEIQTFPDKPKSGWAYTSQAEFLAYYVPGSGDEMVYIIAMSMLRRCLPVWAAAYRLKSAANARYTTFGLLVPLAELERIADKVYSL